MNIELKQAAQQALEAFDAFGDADDFATMFALTQKMNALRTAIQQADAPQHATTEPAGYLYDFKYDDEIVRDWFTQNIDEIQFRPATCLNIRPLYAHPAPGVPDGWSIEEKCGDLIVRKNGFGGYSARKNTESIAEAVLHELALDLLAASPAQKGGE